MRKYIEVLGNREGVNIVSNELFAFVVLQYCAMQETLNCIESIRKYCDDNYIIIVVDNGSPNGAGEKLKSICTDDKCKVIINENNLGFAKGNNVGFRYAKKLGAKYICMMNSDTCLVDNSFIDQIKSDYNKYRYYVLGPNVILNQPEVRVNPLGTHVLEKREANKKIVSLVIQILLVRIGLEKLVFAIQKKKHKCVKCNNEEYNRYKYYENVKLHGCCWIFSPSYIEDYNGLNEDTFLYLEEDMLFLEMRRHAHLMLYSPNVKIYHAEDASTNYISSGRKKTLFVLKNHLNSMVAIVKRIKKLDKEDAERKIVK